MADELKACPFCGDAEGLGFGLIGVGTHSDKYVACHCGARGTTTQGEDDDVLWNARPEEDRLRSALQAAERDFATQREALEAAERERDEARAQVHRFQTGKEIESDYLTQLDEATLEVIALKEALKGIIDEALPLRGANSVDTSILLRDRIVKLGKRASEALGREKA